MSNKARILVNLGLKQIQNDLSIAVWILVTAKQTKIIEKEE